MGFSGYSTPAYSMGPPGYGPYMSSMMQGSAGFTSVPTVAPPKPGRSGPPQGKNQKNVASRAKGPALFQSQGQVSDSEDSEEAQKQLVEQLKQEMAQKASDHAERVRCTRELIHKYGEVMVQISDVFGSTTTAKKDKCDIVFKLCKQLPTQDEFYDALFGPEPDEEADGSGETTPVPDPPAAAVTPGPTALAATLAGGGGAAAATPAGGDGGAAATSIGSGTV